MIVHHKYFYTCKYIIFIKYIKRTLIRRHTQNTVYFFAILGCRKRQKSTHCINNDIANLLRINNLSDFFFLIQCIQDGIFSRIRILCYTVIIDKTVLKIVFYWIWNITNAYVDRYIYKCIHNIYIYTYNVYHIIHTDHVIYVLICIRIIHRLISDDERW